MQFSATLPENLGVTLNGLLQLHKKALFKRGLFFWDYKLKFQKEMNRLQTLFRKQSCSKSQLFAISRSQFSQLLTKKLSNELPKNLTVQLNQRRHLIFIGEHFLDTLKRGTSKNC